MTGAGDAAVRKSDWPDGRPIAKHCIWDIYKHQRLMVPATAEPGRRVQVVVIRIATARSSANLHSSLSGQLTHPFQTESGKIANYPSRPENALAGL